MKKINKLDKMLKEDITPVFFKAMTIQTVYKGPRNERIIIPYKVNGVSISVPQIIYYKSISQLSI